jgi:hypothetical protein
MIRISLCLKKALDKIPLAHPPLTYGSPLKNNNISMRLGNQMSSHIELSLNPLYHIRIDQAILYMSIYDFFF